MSERTFRDAEWDGWNGKADRYDATLGTVTPQVFGPLLDAMSVSAGMRMLDLACGTGALAAEAARRGAEATGLDFAPAMVAEARRRRPGVTFRVGDAEAIPFPDSSLDIVTCSFGMLHMAQPERVLAEIVRVLRPGGRFGMTVWTADGDFFTLVGDAMRAHADPDVPLPPAPPIFRFADPEACRSALLAAGLEAVESSRWELSWQGRAPGEVLDLLRGGTVRTPMMIDAQTPETRSAVEGAILRGAERYRRPGGDIVLRWPALLTVARRPERPSESGSRRAGSGGGGAHE